MEYAVTITDPKVLTRPFTIKLPFARLNRPSGFETYEEACVEGTQSVDKVGFSVKEGGICDESQQSVRPARHPGRRYQPAHRVRRGLRPGDEHLQWTRARPG